MKEIYMNVNLTGHGIELTDGLRSRVEDKFSRLDRYSDHVISSHVVLSIKDKRQIAEVTLKVAKGNDLHAEATTEDMYLSIDEAASKIERQLLKQKDKVITNERKAGEEYRHEEGKE